MLNYHSRLRPHYLPHYRLQRRHHIQVGHMSAQRDVIADIEFDGMEVDE
jgi:hypothetical protein